VAQKQKEKMETMSLYQDLDDEVPHPVEYSHKIEVIQRLMPSLYTNSYIKNE
jgi:hypothetical protein